MKAEDIKSYCLKKHKAVEEIPDEELLNMIGHAYDTVLHSFSQKIQKEITKIE